MIEIDIQRLRNDPAYWDEHAPEGATLYAPTGKDACWFRDGDRGPEAWSTRNTPGRWVPASLSDGFLSTLIPRPTAWRGPEDGLPPVGTVCEVRCVEEWHRCTVVAHLKDHMGMTDAVFQAEDDWDFRQGPEMFRPIKSDKERAVEAAMKVMPYPGSPSTRTDLECAYDAGLLRLPEEQS